MAGTGDGRRTLLVASTGGHLEQLMRLRDRFRPVSTGIRWVTSDEPQSRSLLAGDAPIDVAHLDVPSVAANAPKTSDKQAAGMPDAAEIEAALSRSKGNVMQAARQLKTHARQLYRWIERLSLPLDKYRA